LGKLSKVKPVLIVQSNRSSRPWARPSTARQPAHNQKPVFQAWHLPRCASHRPTPRARHANARRAGGAACVHRGHSHSGSKGRAVAERGGAATCARAASASAIRGNTPPSCARTSRLPARVTRRPAGNLPVACVRFCLPPLSPQRQLQTRWHLRHHPPCCSCCSSSSMSAASSCGRKYRSCRVFHRVQVLYLDAELDVQWGFGTGWCCCSSSSLMD
jgi:hypothetical protein